MPPPTKTATAVKLCSACGYADEREDGTRLCKRFPPTVISEGVKRQIGVGTPGGVSFEVRILNAYPNVTDDPGCGEWVRR